MKTRKQVIENSSIPAKLVNAVLRQIGGTESLPDVMRGGADAGFCGFTYYSDTVPFYKRNRPEILELARQMADDLGEELIAMIAGFNCLKQNEPKFRRELNDEIGRALYGKIGDNETTVANALAWFALEEVARAFCDE